MKYKTFKDFLKSKHSDQYQGDGNDKVDDFRDWLRVMACPDTDDIIKYADDYAAIQKQEIVEEIEKTFQAEYKNYWNVMMGRKFDACLKKIKQKLTP